MLIMLIDFYHTALQLLLKLSDPHLDGIDAGQNVFFYYLLDILALIKDLKDYLFLEDLGELVTV